MKFISVQPASSYFIWQLEVLDESLRVNGYDLSNSIVVLLYNKQVHKNVLKYMSRNKHRVILIPDNREDKSYAASIKPYGMYSVHSLYPNLFKDSIFYHDSDIIFTKYVDWDKYVSREVLMSNTVDYVGSKYIEEKSPVLLELMCKIVGIDVDIVKQNNDNSGGAQIIFPRTFDHSIWKKVYDDSNKLFHWTSENGMKYKPDDHEYPYQSWISEMQSTLWNIWLDGYDTKIIPELDFMWANHKLDSKKNIIHMAGLHSEGGIWFDKREFINQMPFGKTFDKIMPNSSSWLYTRFIQKLDKLSLIYSS